MNRTIGHPGTIIVTQIDGTENFTVSESVRATDEDFDEPGLLGVEYMTASGGRRIVLSSWDLRGSSVLGETEQGARITARAYVPEDAVRLPEMGGYSIPVTMMASTLSGENGTMRLEALCEPDDYVVTVMLVSDVGMWLRYSGTWWGLPSVDTIDGLSAVEITNGALDMYDVADQGGRVLHVSSYPQPDQPGSVEGSPYVQAALRQSVTAAAILIIEDENDVELPVIATARDLLVAIPVGEEHPSIRWYIEKRRAALDPEAVLPWE